MSESPVNPPVEEQRDPILMEILSAIQSLTARVRTLEGPGSNVDTSGEPQPEETAPPAGRNPGEIPVTAQGAEGGSGIHGTVPVPTTKSTIFFPLLCMAMSVVFFY